MATKKQTNTKAAVQTQAKKAVQYGKVAKYSLRVRVLVISFTILSVAFAVAAYMQYN